MMAWLKKIQEAVSEAISTEQDSETELLSFAEGSTGTIDSIANESEPCDNDTLVVKCTDNRCGYVVVDELEDHHNDVEIQPVPEETHEHKMSLRVEMTIDMPIKMKNADGVMYDHSLHIGGGYTGSVKQDSTMHVYDSNFGIWSSLPECPLKWFSMAVFKEQLVLIGGKEVGSHTLNYTNKVAVWNKNKNWDFSFPPMRVARTSPIVITSDNYLIVAGGNKGLLDYSMEIFDSTTQQWIVGPPLPCKCLMHTSAVIGNTWYLMNELDGEVHCTDVPTLINCVLKEKNQHETPEGSENVATLSFPQHQSSLWQKFTPSLPLKPFRIVSSGEHLLAFSSDDSTSTIKVHVYDSKGTWVRCGKLPELCSNASVLSDDHQLLLFGGDATNKQYSQKLFKLSLLSEVAANTKKPQRVTIGGTNIV